MESVPVPPAMPPSVSVHANMEALPSPSLPRAPASPCSCPMTGYDFFTPQAPAVGERPPPRHPFQGCCPSEWVTAGERVVWVRSKESNAGLDMVESIA